MKLTKKLLPLLLCAALAIFAVSCNEQNDPTEPHSHSYLEGKCSCGATDPDYKPHEHSYTGGKCECGATDSNYEAHEHSYTGGKCECGATDPDYSEPHEHSYVDGMCECGDIEPGSPLALLLESLAAQREELKTHTGKISRYDDSDTEILLFQSYTADIGTATSGAPTVTPSAEHPRLLLNKSTLPKIRENLAKDGVQAARFAELLASDILNDAALGTAYDQSSIDKHNLSYEYLEIIQAKALGYLTEDNAYYGYQAILYMKNFLKTLDIETANEQMRHYGYVMFTAALVYDWCYDLLTEEDKIQFIAGVENCLCRGENKSGAKIELGFPPTTGRAVAGHSCEYILLRDYLSFAIAIYGDNDSWWDLIGGRVYGEFIPVRNYYYQSGMTSQGTGTYITARFVGDIYSAWMLTTSTGTNPYTNMEKVLRSCLSYEVTPGKLLGDGDGGGDYVDAFRYMDIAYMSAYLFGDSTVLAHANYLLGDRPLSCDIHKVGYMGIDNPIYMALTGLSDVEPAEDRYADLDLINYNGAPLGDYLIHSAWNSPDAVTVFMRIKERTTAGHEHDDSGTFEIYYKGALSTDGGIYGDPNHVHMQYFHQATISHNGLLIYDPSRARENEGWYSGSQRDVRSTSTNLNAWLGSDVMKRGEIIAHESAYTDASERAPLYAYLAGDITAAYDSATVSYVGRRMLTVFTGDSEFPMVFFVYDDITAKDAGFEKRFLLQISSPDAPIIDNTDKTVVTENEGGRLVLTSLTDEIKISGQGGRNEGKYDGAKAQNYLINGKQCTSSSRNHDDGHWGRVEIVYTGKNASSTFMNVIYVTDKGNSSYAKVESITNATNLEGGVFDGRIAGLFATDRAATSKTLSCTTSGEGNLDYYVSGLSAGSWQISVGGRSYGSYTATEEGGFITFTAPAGDVVISRSGRTDTIMYEDFSSAALNKPTEAVTVNGIKYSATDMSKCEYSIVNDPTGKALLIETTGGVQFQPLSNLYEALCGETSVSFVISLAKVQGESVLPISFRMRDGQSGNNYNVLFQLDAAGNVKLGNKTTVGTLTTELTEYRFVVDFAAGKMLCYGQNGTVSSVALSPQSGASTTLEWLTYMTKRYFDCAASNASGSLKIGEIGIYRGNIFD